jgi:nitrate/nitrite-specific signal transduction histidine kinase
MKIKYKLALGFLMMSSLIIFAGIINIYTNKMIITSYEMGEKHYSSIIMDSVEISSYAKRAEGHLMLFLTLNDTSNIEKFFQRIDSLKNYTILIDQKSMNPETRTIIEEIKSQSEKLQSQGESLIKIYKNETETSGKFDFNKHSEEILNINKFASLIRENGVKIVNIQMQLKIENENKSKKLEQNIKNIVLLTILTIFIFSIILGYIISKNISRSITKIRDAAIDIGKGNLSPNLTINTRDEFKDLETNFMKMANELKESRKSLEESNKFLSKKTNELIDKNKELEKFNRLSIDRELQMVKLKEEIAKSKKGSGK